jgi:photosystem II oxygen-evolving enhancer protein 2
MLKSLAIALFCLSCLWLTGCAVAASGVQRYVDAGDGYEFLYPNGWVQVSVKGQKAGLDAMFKDLIERGENLSVVISQVDPAENLTDLGTPTDIGRRFLKNLELDPDIRRKTELIGAESFRNLDKTYYILEYQVKLPNQVERHNLATIATSRGKLYTFNLSTAQNRWDRVENLFELSARSFTVY